MCRAVRTGYDRPLRGAVWEENRSREKLEKIQKKHKTKDKKYKTTTLLNQIITITEQVEDGPWHAVRTGYIGPLPRGR